MNVVKYLLKYGTVNLVLNLRTTANKKYILYEKYVHNSDITKKIVPLRTNRRSVK